MLPAILVRCAPTGRSDAPVDADPTAPWPVRCCHDPTMAVMSLGRVFGWLAERDPDAVAVHDGSGALTRRDLDRRSNRLARRLTALGVGVDDVVTVGLPSTAELVVLCAAIWKAGATPQLLAPDHPAAELREIVDLTAPALVVGFPDVDLGERPTVLEPDSSEPDSSEPDSSVPDVHAASWKAPVSGGSTGRPKIVFSATPATVDPTRPTAPYVPANAVQLVTAPLHHSAPFLFAMRGLFLGHTLVLLPRFDPVTALRSIETHRVTWALFVPATMQQVWHLDPAVREAFDVSSLESVLHVGAACPAWLKRAWIGWLGPDRVTEIYAGTESTGVTVIGGREWLEHPGSVGRPAPGTTVRVLDDDGRDVAPGTVGRVFLRPRGGPGSTYRYVGATSAPVDGFETLGDLGWLDADGYLHLADRAADVITTAAGPVYPTQVEAVLDAHPAVRSSAAIGLPDGRPGGGHERVHAVVDTAGADVTAAAVQAWAAQRLPPAAAPGTVELVDHPLRDDAGKVRRSRLRSARVSQS